MRIDFTGVGTELTVEKKQKPMSDRKPRTYEDPEDRPLTPKQERFCVEYVKSNNGEQAAIAAGYSPGAAGMMASETLRKPNVIKRLNQLRAKLARPSIADATEVMEFFTQAMRGEMKDQFGLDMSVSDRTKAAIELAKRTVDLDNKLAGKADATVEIKLDWKRD